MLKVKIHRACSKIRHIIAKAVQRLARLLSYVCILYLCAIAISTILYFARGIELPFVANLTWPDLVAILLLQMYCEKLAISVDDSYLAQKLVSLLKADSRKSDRNN